MKKKLLAVLLSAVVAFGLWVYVITVVNPESEKTYYDIPVVLQNKDILTERGLMIVSEVPTVTLVLKSERTILNALNESNINVIANVANIEKPGNHSLTYTIAYPGNIPPNSVSTQGSSTDLIVLKIENKVRKSVPVVIDYGETAVQEGYIADKKNVQLSYNDTALTHIEVSGPESVIGQIHKAVINVDLTNQTKTIVGQYQYTLCNEAGEPVDAEKVTTNTESVNLSLKIERVKEIELLLEVIYGGGATQETALVTFDPMQIQVSGSDQLLEKLDSLTIGTINLREMLEDTTMTFPITLPEGVTNRTGVEQVTVDVKFQNLMLKTFNVTNITPVNIPAGLDAKIITKTLQVTVRGPVETIQAMKDTDVSVVVDFSQAQPGTATMDATVVIRGELTNVGAVGTYQVSATVKD